MVDTQAEVKATLETFMANPSFPIITLEFERLLSILGNVEGDEIVALVLMALENAQLEEGA